MAEKAAAKPGKSKKPSGRGGYRPNAGRRSKAAQRVDQAVAAVVGPKEMLPADAKERSAEFAFWLHDKLMRDEAEDHEIRLGAAREVMNRVWGKPRQAVDVTSRGKSLKTYLVVGPEQL